MSSTRKNITRKLAKIKANFNGRQKKNNNNNNNNYQEKNMLLV